MIDVLAEIKKHVRPCGESEIIDDILGPFRKLVESGELPLVLFCAGSSGAILHRLLTKQGIFPVCFCDNNAARTGAPLCGIPIISFADLKSNYRNSLILIASAAYQNFVKKQLLDNGFHAERILTLDTRDTSFDAQLRRERVLMYARNGEPTAVLDDLQRDEERIVAAYHLLADDKSRQLFIRRLALIASGYEYQAYQSYLREFSEPVLKFGYDNPERFRTGGSYFYFNNDVLMLQDDEVLVDGGAYSGDSAEEFMLACERNNVRYKHIYCFEPDAANYLQLVENASKCRDMTCLNYGLWSHRATLRFVSSAQVDSYCARILEQGGAAQGSADVRIETASIDERLAGERVTLIKMDIEGAEIEAIRGAAETIKSHSPKLALSVYHETTDLYEIPLMIQQLKPGSRMYLRHLGNYFDDTMLFAVWM